MRSVRREERLTLQVKTLPPLKLKHEGGIMSEHMICPKADKCHREKDGKMGCELHVKPHPKHFSCNIRGAQCPACVPCSEVTPEVIKPATPQHCWTGKELTVWEIIRDSEITTNELYGLVDWIQQNFHQPRANLFVHSGFINYAIKHRCFRNFLLLFGYIEEVTQDWL